MTTTTIFLASIILILLIAILSPNIVYFIHKRYFTWTTSSNKPLLSNGDIIEITYLPPCKNSSRFSRNPYIGMKGIVQDFDGTCISLFTGDSYLIVNNIKQLKFKKL